MSPTLGEGDTLIGWLTAVPKTGRIVCFSHPSRKDFWMVKRVVAVGGDVVEIVSGALMVNDTTSTHLVADLRPVEPDGRWVVGNQEMFVLSDAHHLTRSDSRTLGPVTTRDSYVVVWPRP